MASVLIVAPSGRETEQIARGLSAAGHRVNTLDGGSDTISRWRADRPELVVLDSEVVRGPGALELAAQLKSESPGGFMPILLICPGSDVNLRVAALQQVDDVIPRPFDVSEVTARATALLRTRRLVDDLRAAQKDSESRSLSDPATNLRNRIFMNERLNEEWRRAARYNEPLSLILLSVDNWNQIVDSRGQGAGDRVLLSLANQALRSLRQIDVVTRYGAAELAALLPNTHFAGSCTCADRLRRAFVRMSCEGVAPTVSMGISFFPGKDVAEPTDLVRLAQRALERAREEGPGQICLVQHQGYILQPR